jgi:hypothetical protein
MCQAWERPGRGLVWVEFSILLGFSGHVGGWFFEPDFVEVVRDSLVFCCNLFCHEGEFWTSLLAKYSLKNWRVFFVSHVAVGGWRWVFVGPFGSCSMPLAALGGWSLANVNHDKWRPLKYDRTPKSSDRIVCSLCSL